MSFTNSEKIRPILQAIDAATSVLHNSPERSLEILEELSADLDVRKEYFRQEIVRDQVIPLPYKDPTPAFIQLIEDISGLRAVLLTEMLYRIGVD
jgi:hypothetical protein